MNFEKEIKLLQLQVSDILRKIKAKSTSWGQIIGNIKDQKDLMRYFDLKQNLLKSGKNIKTINGSSLLGYGDLQVTSSLGFTPENVANKAIDFTTINDTLYPSVEAVVDYVAANSGSEKSIRCFYNSWNMATLDQWRGWNFNQNMLVTDGSNAYGTGTEPTKSGTWFGDSAVFVLNGYSELKKLTFHVRNGNPGNTIQLYVVVADYVAARGTETNGVVIINESITIASGSTLKDNFTIATHSLNPKSVMHVFYRRTGAATNNLFSVQLSYEFT